MTSEALRRSLLRIVSEQIIPTVEKSATSPLLFMEPDNLLRRVPGIIKHRGTPLNDSKRQRSPLYLNQWEAQQVHAIRFPCCITVVEGEIDWRIGVTQTAAQAAPNELKHTDYLVVPIQAGTVCLMPPGVPYSAGGNLHWERREARLEHAVIFWMLILPSGFMCHFCRSTATLHHYHRSFFVPCPQVHQHVKMLEEEVRHESLGSEAIVQLHLQAIFRYAQQRLQGQSMISPISTESIVNEMGERGGAGQNNPLQRAQTYIETHLGQPLNATIIAEQAYLSVRHLDRYFQRECGMSMMDYVATRRIEAARVLLMTTDLPVSQIGETVGYENASSFTQVFKRRTGMSPLTCRQQRMTVEIEKKSG